MEDRKHRSIIPVLAIFRSTLLPPRPQPDATARRSVSAWVPSCVIVSFAPSR